MYHGIQENGKKDSLVSEGSVLDSGASRYKVYLLHTIHTVYIYIYTIYVIYVSNYVVTHAADTIILSKLIIPSQEWTVSRSSH